MFNGKCVVSGSLDGYVKVFEIFNWNVVFGCKYFSFIFFFLVIVVGVV